MQPCQKLSERQWIPGLCKDSFPLTFTLCSDVCVIGKQGEPLKAATPTLTDFQAVGNDKPNKGDKTTSSDATWSSRH
eukprot:6032239-Amphidinium_carterae.1